MRQGDGEREGKRRTDGRMERLARDFPVDRLLHFRRRRWPLSNSRIIVDPFVDFSDIIWVPRCAIDSVAVGVTVEVAINLQADTIPLECGGDVGLFVQGC